MMRLPSLMAAILLIVILLAVTGCTTVVPVTAKFPDMPEMLMKPCPNLEKLKEDAKLSDVAKTVTVNYTTYYDCAVKHDGMVQWYKIQRHLYESGSK